MFWLFLLAAQAQVTPADSSGQAEQAEQADTIDPEGDPDQGLDDAEMPPPPDGPITDPIARIKAVQWEHNAPILVGLAGPDAARLAARWSAQLSGSEFRIQPVPILGVVDREMAYALDKSELACGTRLQWLTEPEGWQLTLHGDCSHTDTSPEPPPKAIGNQTLRLVSGEDPDDWQVYEGDQDPIDATRFAELTWDPATVSRIASTQHTAKHMAVPLLVGATTLLSVAMTLHVRNTTLKDPWGSDLNEFFCGSEDQPTDPTTLRHDTIFLTSTAGMLVISSAAIGAKAQRLQREPSAWYTRSKALERIERYNNTVLSQ